MTTLKQWLIRYSESHQNPTNKVLHWICIPLIVFSLACASKAIPVGTATFNVATVVGALALAWYARLSWTLAVGMVVIFGAMYALVLATETLLGSTGMLIAAGVIFFLAWVGQFIGHHVEGAKPSFFEDLQFLLVGPLWLLADVYRRMAIPLGGGVATQH